MDIKKMGDKFLLLNNIKYFVTIFILSLILYLGDYLCRTRTVCEIEPLSTNGYLIKNTGCSIPNYLTYSINPKPNDKIYSAPCLTKLPQFVQSQTSKEINGIYIDKPLVKYLFGNLKHFNCSYCPCSKKDFKNCLNKMYPLKSSARIFDLYVSVNCSYKNKNFYHDFFAFPSNYKVLSNIEKDKTLNGLNVIVWGLEGVSRQGFHRQFQRTSRKLLKLHAIQFLGYNKIGDSACSNLIPLLTGLKSEAFYKKKMKSTIFDDFKNKGYLTSFAEEGNELINVFDYYGFNKNIDFFWSSEYLNYYELVCTKDKLFQYSENLFKHLEGKGRKFFGLFWHKKYDYIDQHLEKFFFLLNRTGFLNNTILIFVSDQGDQNNEFRLTHLGSIESRLPLLYVYLPSWYKQDFREGHCNLIKNSERLVTTFDIHKTLQSLTDPFNVNYEREFNLEKSVSLFTPISTRRTCENVGISPHFCTCNAFINVGIKRYVSFEIADYVKNYTYYKSGYDNFKGMRILTNRLHLSNVWVPQNYTDYTVLFQEGSCNKYFEATIRRMNGTGFENRYKLIDDVSHIINYDCHV